MTPADASRTNKKGSGLSIGFLMFAAAAEGLLKLRQELPADLTAEDFRTALIERKDEAGVPLFSKLAAYQGGQGAGAWNLREVSHQLVDIAFAGREELTLAEALQYVDEKGHWWELILSFVDEMVAGDKASAVPDLLGGHCGVRAVPIGDGFKLPVMVAVATPFTPRKEWLDRVSYQFQRKFEPMAQMKPESLREAARALPGWLKDEPSVDIADKLFEEEGYRDQLRRDHPEKSRAELEKVCARANAKRAARLRKRKERFLEVVKKVMGGTSQA